MGLAQPPGLSPPGGLALQAFPPQSFCSVISSSSGMGEAGAVLEHLMQPKRAPKSLVGSSCASPWVFLLSCATDSHLPCLFPQVSVAGYGMDEAEQDQYEARLKELFDSFDSTGTGSLGQEELTDLCHMLHLEEVAPALQQTLLQGNLLGRVRIWGEMEGAGEPCMEWSWEETDVCNLCMSNIPEVLLDSWGLLCSAGWAQGNFQEQSW